MKIFLKTRYCLELIKIHIIFLIFTKNRITFSNSFRDMTYDHYLEQKILMCEVKLNQILAKNPLTYRLNRFSSNPYTKIYTNQEIIIVSERN